jgi:hypothetical protein
MAAKKKAVDPTKKAVAKKAAPVKKAAPAKKTAAKKTAAPKKKIEDKIEEVKAEVNDVADEVFDAIIWADTVAQETAGAVKKLSIWKRLFGKKS